MKEEAEKKIKEKVDEKVGDHESRVETAVEILEDHLSDSQKEKVANAIDEVDGVIAIQTIVNGDSSVADSADSVLNKASKGHLGFETVDEVA